jgi:ABC-2 type transport system ATP-binding protein
MPAAEKLDYATSRPPTVDRSLAIDLNNVTKVYRGRVHALQGIEMRVGRGEVFGLLGPNGAGKSTLVKIMMSVVRPTKAGGTILGNAIGDKATLGRVGYLPENHRFPRYLTGRQILDFFGAMAKVDRATRKKRAGELLDVVGMTGAADRKIATYSKGMAQRIGLAQALMNEPDLVVLDEPTDGVDPEGRRDIRDVLGRLRSQGKTVFINSHLLSELEMVSDRVAILVAGRVAKQGTIDELTFGQQRYEIEVVPTNHDPAGAIRAALPNVFNANPAQGKLPTGHWVTVTGPVVSVGSTEPGDIQFVLDTVRTASLTVRRVQLIRPSLEDLFIDIVAARPPGIMPPPPLMPPAIPTADVRN